MKMKKRIFYFIAIIIYCVAAQPNTVLPMAYASSDIAYVTETLIEWKKGDVGSEKEGFLLNDKFLEQAGTTAGDWYPIALGRLGVNDNRSGYLAVINDNITQRYAGANKLDKAKATEWHRISLAVLASGGNPRKAGNDGNIDLIADGTFNRVENGTGILGKQGINGFIWGLITLDSMSYEVPDDAFYSRDDMILNILNRQLSDGGWALTGSSADPDMTAMAIQSLAPYYNSEKVYCYRNENISDTIVEKKVGQAVDEALQRLSEMQLKDGDFRSWGTENSESCSQVIIALCALGIDIFSDRRFITESGKTVYDGLLKYRNGDGGFLHSYAYDEENPAADPQKSNSMAGEQALCALAAISRSSARKRRLYDFRPEMSEDELASIKEAERKIEALDYSSSSNEIKEVYEFYLGIDGTERSYVCNYAKLSSVLSFAGIPYAEEKTQYNSGDAGIITPMEEFGESDRIATDALPDKLTTADRAEVLRLWSKINNCFDFDGKSAYVIKLEKAKNEIEDITTEIEDIKSEIKSKLYPFDSIGLKDRSIVNSIYNRFDALSEYDKSTFEKSDIEGLLKAKKQVDTLFAATIICITLGFVSVLIVGFVILHIRKRKREKLSRQMTESDE